MNWKIIIGALLLISALRGFFVGEDLNTAFTSLVLGALLINWHYKFHLKLLQASASANKHTTPQMKPSKSGSDARLFIALAQAAEVSSTIDDLNELCSRLLEELEPLTVTHKTEAEAYLTDCQILIDQENTEWDEFLDGIGDTSTDILTFLENMAHDEGFEDTQSYLRRNYADTNSLIIHLSINYCIANAKYEVER